LHFQALSCLQPRRVIDPRGDGIGQHLFPIDRVPGRAGYALQDQLQIDLSNVSEFWAGRESSNGQNHCHSNRKVQDDDASLGEYKMMAIGTLVTALGERLHVSVMRLSRARGK
jgi:hypothetical protein